MELPHYKFIDCVGGLVTGLIGFDGSPLRRNQAEAAQRLENLSVHDDNCKQRHGENQERASRSCLRSRFRLRA